MRRCRFPSVLERLKVIGADVVLHTATVHLLLPVVHAVELDLTVGAGHTLICCLIPHIQSLILILASRGVRPTHSKQNMKQA